MNESSPPLKVWFYTFTVVVSLLLFSIFFLEENSKKRIEIQAYIKKILKTNHKSHTTILFLGSSLTGCALDNLADIKNRFNKKNQKKIFFFRLAISGLDNELLEALQIFDYIIESPPDYLFIESNRINIDNGYINLLNSSVNNLISFAKKPINSIVINESVNIKNNPEDPISNDYFDSNAYYILLEKKRFVRTFSQNKKANKAYSELIKRKTKIIFLDMPRAPKLEMVWLTSDQKKDLQTLIQTYDQKYGIAYWKYPYSMRNADFTDGYHLNYKGAKKYQEWLAAQFKLLR
jgi:hypothetical protein